MVVVVVVAATRTRNGRERRERERERTTYLYIIYIKSYDTNISYDDNVNASGLTVLIHTYQIQLTVELYL